MVELAYSMPELPGGEKFWREEVVCPGRVDVFEMRYVSSRDEFQRKGDSSLTSTFLTIVSRPPIIQPSLPTLPCPF